MLSVESSHLSTQKLAVYPYYFYRRFRSNTLWNSDVSELLQSGLNDPYQNPCTFTHTCVRCFTLSLYCMTRWLSLISSWISSEYSLCLDRLLSFALLSWYQSLMHFSEVQPIIFSVLETINYCLMCESSRQRTKLSTFERFKLLMHFENYIHLCQTNKW